ncbi:hypothetical protein [Sneathiella limimaris]|uniref:hypothetical protein n=1 Tax=Sneathiella limimaris TaxID=1964213 RepID=UPI00146B2DB7|nr:hypothetical protein [Sneathiella limimaris]
MSVSTVTESQFAYMDRMIEGGAQHTYAQKSASVTEATSSASSEGEEFSFFGKDGFGFDDFLDIINPLQHIPVVSTIYREITGDELAPGARLIGGGLFGGAIGLASSVVNTVVEVESGKDIGEHVASLFSDDAVTDTVQVAATPEASAAPSPLVDAQAAKNIAAEQAPTVQKASAEQLAAAQMMAAAMRSTPVTTQKDTDQSAQVESITQTSAATPDTAKPAPTLAMGLEWKTQPPNLQKTIDKIQTQHGVELSASQISQLMNSLGKAPGLTPKTEQPNQAVKSTAPEIVSDATPVTRHKASSAYDKGVDLAASLSASQNPYAYMNQSVR